ncbi:hypothetical protein AABM17_915 [Neisseria musculi]|uniref:Uncharacterized protein n=1 Tax=Neisseria musculi TaxID=1815583 RepID=A0A7H1MEL4_9NEIS|nr:hypothetical protein H7A79_0915 [Neisseria musculi]
MLFCYLTKDIIKLTYPQMDGRKFNTKDLYSNLNYFLTIVIIILMNLFVKHMKSIGDNIEAKIETH